MLLRTPEQTILPTPLVIDAAGHRHSQTGQLLYLGGTIHENAGLSREIDRRMRLIMRTGTKKRRPGLVR